jgi:NPCBM/NEW2 domain/Secretion system C-terminal sorting domain/Carbohydrate esterase, sialic acid-specific acetylesterase
MNKIYKYLIGLSFVLLIEHSAYAQIPESNPNSKIRINWPIDRMVFQRNLNGNANIQLAGQYGYGYENRIISYRIVPLDPKTGEYSGAASNWTNITFQSFTSGLTFRQFYVNLGSIASGWYSLQLGLQSTSNPLTVVVHTARFGVGDVYVIAGQSNARGFEESDDKNLIPQYNGNLTGGIPDGVNVINVYSQSFNGVSYSTDNNNLPIDEDQKANGGLPLNQKYSKIAITNTNPTKPDRPFPIYPMGPASWCYAPLGYNLLYGANASNVPVSFLNAATGGTSLNDWLNNATVSGRLKNTLRTFGSLMGVKSILWHQGESDSDALNTDAGNTPTSPIHDASRDNYKDKLNTLIGNIGGYFSNSLQWYISKVSYHSLNSGGYYIPNPPTKEAPTNSAIIDGQSLVISADSNDNKREGISTDDLDATKRGSTNKVHFNDATHLTVADKWAATKPWNHSSPFLSADLLALANITTYATNSYTLTAPLNASNQNYLYYYWVKNNNGIENALPNGSNRVFNIPPFWSGAKPTNVNFYTCYVSNDNIHLQATQPFVMPNTADEEQSLRVETVLSYDLGFNNNQQSRTVTVNSTNSAWTTTVTYDPSNLGNWLTVGTTNGGFGNTNMNIAATSNTTANIRKATVKVTDESNNTIFSTISVTQSGTGSSCLQYLSDLPFAVTPEQACCGYPNSNYPNLNLSIGGNLLTIGGKVYNNPQKGIGTHANSTLTYNIPSGVTRFKAEIGRDDEADGCCNGDDPNVKFTIFVKSGNTISTPSGGGPFTLGPANAAQIVDVDVSGKSQLILVTEKIGENYGDHADWALARFECNGGNGLLTDGGCYTITPVSNPAYMMEAMSDGTIQKRTPVANKPEQIWKAESVLSAYKFTSQGGNKDQVIKLNTGTIYAEWMRLGSFLNDDKYKWYLENNGGAFRISKSNGITWDMEAAGGGDHLQTYGNTSENFLPYRLWNFSAVTCPTAGGSPCTDKYITDNSITRLSWSQACCGNPPQTGLNFDGGQMKINTTNYTNGVGTHANSEIVYDLGNNHPYNYFKAQVGSDYAASGCPSCGGTIIFKVYDYNANTLINGYSVTASIANPGPFPFSVPITGVSKIKLVVEQGNDNNWADHADWGNARVTCTNVQAREAVSTEPEKQEFSIFPNPTNDKLTVKFGLENQSEVAFSLTDMQGKALENYQYKGEKGNHTFIIEVGQLPQGIYILHGNIENKMNVKKFVIER